MCNENKDTARKEESHAEVTDSQRRNAPLWTAWETILAGLFALWSTYQEKSTVKFAAAAGISPSVWFPGWLEYAKTKQIRTKQVYLSLGDREEKTRNAVMRQVGQNIREMDRWYRNNEKIECVLEWNEGNHFRDVDVRCGKGFLWCMGKIWYGKTYEIIKFIGVFFR